MAEREYYGQKFLDTKPCCMDRGFCRELKKTVDTMQKLFDPLIMLFLVLMFNRCLLATTFIECLFAALRQWLLLSNKPMALSSLAAKHMTHKATVRQQRTGHLQRWLGRGGKRQHRQRMTRPVWAHSKKSQARKRGQRVTSFNLYFRRMFANRLGIQADNTASPLYNAVMQQIHKDWKDMPAPDKEAWRQEARSLRIQRGFMGNPLKQFLEEDPNEDYPISKEEASAILEEAAGVHNKAELWRKRAGEEVQPDVHFPSTIHHCRGCLEYLPDCHDRIQPEHLQGMESIIDDLKLIFVPNAGKSAKEVPECKLIMAQSCGAGLVGREYIAIQGSSVRKNPFAGEFLDYDMEGDFGFWEDDLASAELPLNLVLAYHEQPGGFLPRIYTEDKLAHTMVQKSFQWEYYECAYGIASLIPDPATGVPDLSRLKVTSMKKLDLHAMVDMCVMVWTGSSAYARPTPMHH